MRALCLVNQLWFIVPVTPWKNRMSSESLYKSNRPQLKEFGNRSPAARDLRILLVFCPHPSWLISL